MIDIKTVKPGDRVNFRGKPVLVLRAFYDCNFRPFLMLHDHEGDFTCGAKEQHVQPITTLDQDDPLDLFG